MKQDVCLRLTPLKDSAFAGLQREWPDAAQDFRVQAACNHEHRMLIQAAAAQVPGVSLPAGQPLALYYHTSLTHSLAAQPPATLSLHQKLTLALALTQALASLHQQDIFHLALRPAVFLLSPALDYAEIIDLSAAHHCPRGSLGLTAHQPAFADPTWLSPEQSYPTDRLADNRTDLYSLGCILAWLFTGQPPFAHLKGERAIAYGHVAGQPALPLAGDHPADQALQQLLLRLLEKDADNRYQSCAGLLHDLKTLQAGYYAGHVPTLSHQQIADRLHIPQRLYGRDSETRSLITAFNRIKSGACEALLIGGYAGVGKSSLVHDVRTRIVQAGGLFISGKFDQLQHGMPCSALVQAFNRVLHHLLSQPEAEIARWREQLNNALYPNAQLLVELIPDLAQLLGPQPAVSATRPDEQQNRFNRTVRQFVQTLSTAQTPLVIFIDDLHWADSASINLLSMLLGTPHCLLLGAYRDNEIDAQHPLRQILANPAHAEQLQHITLEPLTTPVLTRLIADTVHQPDAQSAPLAELILQKTHGNPFFVRQFTQELYQRGLLQFDYSQGWHWSIEAIEQQSITDNVVELMLHRIKRLPPAQQHLLQQAAGVGAHVPLALLSQLNGEDEASLQTQLAPILAQGLLVPVHAQHNTEAPAQVRFLHDKVQQAAYSRWQPDARQQLHLALGRLLLHRLNEQAIHERCYELVGHLNQATRLLNTDERYRLLALNQQAAHKARAATAYATAVGYLETALQLACRLDVAAEQRTDMQLLRLECLYQAGEFSQAEVLKSQVQARCDSPALRTRFYVILIHQYTHYGDLQQAMQQGLEALTSLGGPLPCEPTQADVTLAINQVQQQLAQQPFAQLATKRPAGNPHILLQMDVLMAMQPCCYSAAPVLLPLTVLRLMQLTLTHGNTPYSSYVYGTYAVLCIKVMKDYESAFEAMRYAHDVAQKWPHNPRLEGRLLMMCSNFIQPWQQPLQHSASIREKAYQNSLAQGDYYWAAHSYIFGFYGELFSTPSLSQLLARTEQLQHSCQQMQQTTQAHLCQLHCNLLHMLQGTLDNPLNLDHQPGFEQQTLAHYQQHSYQFGSYDRLLARLIQGYLHGNYNQTLEITLAPALSADDLDTGLFHEAVYTLFHLLSLTALQLRKQPLSAHQQQWWQQAWPRYQRWYALNPDTFAAGYHLLMAEQAMLAGDSIEARCGYERAAGYAARAGQALLQGIACERFAHFCHHQGDTSLTRAWLEKALKVYQDWGAHACADRMENRLASFSDQHLRSVAHNMDWQAALEATQCMARQQAAPALIDNLLQRAIAMTGAQQAALFEPVSSADTAAWRCIGLCREGIPLNPDHPGAPHPLSVLDFCRNSHKPLALKDAIRQGSHTQDNDLQQRQVHSLLALPLLVQQQFSGVLYLEHSAHRHLFSHQKVRVMELLAGQFAIGWQNSKFYAQLQQYNEQLEQTVHERTRQLDLQNQHLEAVLQALPIPFVLTTLDGEIIESNEQVYQLFEYPMNAPGKLDARAFYVDTQDRKTLLRQLQSHGHINDFECQLKTALGNVFWAQFSVTLLNLERGPALFATIRDISARKAREAQLHEQASTDPLTGALNRRAFLEQAQALGTGTPLRSVAMLDLDHFKILNDRWGHAAGDKVLSQFVQTVQTMIGPDNLLGRMGGEEFALVLPHTPLADASRLLKQICDRAAAMRVTAGAGQLNFTTSAGVTGWDADESLEAALERADQLLYQAKRAGRNQVHDALLTPSTCSPL